MRPAILNPLFYSCSRLKGVGEKVQAGFVRLFGVPETKVPMLRDMLYHIPYEVVDRSKTYPLTSAPSGEIATFVVKVDAHFPPPGGFRNKRTPYKVTCSNETGDITLVFFHASNDYMQQALPVGQERVISGKVEVFNYTLQMTHPDIIAPVHKLAEIQKPEPCYPLTEGITNRKIIQCVQQVMQVLPDLPEWLPAGMMQQKDWPAWKTAWQTLHNPPLPESILPESPARQRLSFDELLAHQLHLGLRRRKYKSQTSLPLAKAEASFSMLEKLLPFALTNDQRHAIEMIAEDMSRGSRMVRMVQGDVGSGKTMVALFAMLQAVASGFQAAFMAPTEIVATQHFAGLKPYLDQLDIRCALLLGGMRSSEKEALAAQLVSGELQVIIGTHALFQEGVQYKDLALAVIDEQHRFGVEQRMQLARKGTYPHLLHMSATPIPRSLMMTYFGDMECSIIREKPQGRKPITTRVVPLSRYDEVVDGMERALAGGEKIYWLCPKIGEQDLFSDDLESSAAVEARYHEFNARFAGKVAMVHGRMASDERDRIMRAFKAGEYAVLVATTVIEVGVDVPDATIIIIEQAEKFGLSQLHQLRGRVGRGDKPSSCVLLYSDKAGEVARQRLSILRESNDGFAIADADLRMRGSGDILGTKQSGLPKFYIASPWQQPGLLEEARRVAEDIMSQDQDRIAQNSPLHCLLCLFGYDNA